MSSKFLDAIKAQDKALEAGLERGKRAYADEPNITPIPRVERGKFKRSIPDEEIMAVLEAQKRGMGRAKIAKETGMKPAAVYNITRRYELKQGGGFRVLGKGG